MSYLQYYPSNLYFRQIKTTMTVKLDNSNTLYCITDEVLVDQITDGECDYFYLLSFAVLCYSIVIIVISPGDKMHLTLILKYVTGSLGLIAAFLTLVAAVRRAELPQNVNQYWGEGGDPETPMPRP